MVNDDLSSHRTRSNVRPVPTPDPPHPPASLIVAVDEVFDAGEWKL